MKLLGIGDIHLGRQPSRLAPELVEEVPARDPGPAAAWRLAVDFALEAEVDAVLLAGDVVEQEDDFYEAFRDLRSGVERLAAAGVRVLAVSGNHDVQVLPRLADAVPGVRLLGRGGCWEAEEVEGRDGRRASVLGWSFPEPRVRTSPLAAFALPDLTGQSGSVPVIGLLHCDRDAPGSPYAPVRSAELANAPVDAWLLGHIHAPDALRPPRPMGYLGSLTGLDPGEPGARGPWLLEWDESGPAIEHVPLAPLRWEEVEVEVPDGGLDEAEDVHGLVTAALDALLERLAAARHRPRAVGCRLRFTGRSRQGKAIEDTLAASDPQRLVHWRGDIACFVHDWRMAVLPAIDLDSLARGADPPALLARRILALRGADDGERRALIDGARRRLESGPHVRRFTALRPEPPPDEAIAALLERAALRALAGLLGQRDDSHASPMHEPGRSPGGDVA